MNGHLHLPAVLGWASLGFWSDWTVYPCHWAAAAALETRTWRRAAEPIAARRGATRRSRAALQGEKTKRKQLEERRCHLAIMIMTSGHDCQLQGKILHHNINNGSRLGRRNPEELQCQSHVFTGWTQIIKSLKKPGLWHWISPSLLYHEQRNECCWLSHLQQDRYVRWWYKLYRGSQVNSQTVSSFILSPFKFKYKVD